MSDKNRKVTQGAVAYMLRHVCVTGLAFFANILLLKFLTLDQFGVIAILNLCIALFAILAEGGLNVYLIQQEGGLNSVLMGRFFKLQKRVYYTIHLALTLIVISCYFTSVGVMQLIYVWCIAFAVFPSLVRGRNFVILERKLEFSKIALIESIEAVVYTAFSIVLAWLGAGVWSIVIAALARSSAGALLSCRIVDFRCLAADNSGHTDDVSKALRFGLNYHTPALLGILRGVANPVIMGPLLGLAAVGICDRSGFIAGIPLWIVGAVQARVLFPFFSGIQGDVSRAIKLFSRSLYISGVLDKALYVPLMVASASLPVILGDKWTPAIPVIEVMCVGNMIFGSLVSSGTPFLNGLGKALWLARLSVFSTAATWVLALPLIGYFGVIGFAYISIINWLPVVFLIWFMRKKWSQIRILASWSIPVIAAVIAIGVVKLSFISSVYSLGNLCGQLVIALIIYSGLVVLLDQKRAIGEFRTIVANIVKRSGGPHVQE